MKKFILLLFVTTQAFARVVAIEPTYTNSIVKIKADRYVCTGVIIAPNLVLTANHCTLKQEPKDDLLSPENLLEQVQVSFNNGTSNSGTIIRRGKDVGYNDLALILVSTPTPTPTITLSYLAPSEWAANLAWNFRLFHNIIELRTGSYVEKYWLYGRETENYLMKLSFEAIPGKSGSPVFDNHGNLVGIVVRMLTSRSLNENEGFALAVPTPILIRFLNN